MTRKDYTILAKVIRDSYRIYQNDVGEIVIRGLASRLIEGLMKDNEKFKPSLFLDRCFPK